jgi:hypothetical protein
VIGFRQDSVNAERLTNLFLLPTLRKIGEAQCEFVDLEWVLAFAQTIVSRSSRLWVESSLDQKQRPQKVLFPEGIRFDGEGFGTGITSLFNMLSGVSEQKHALASL